jgi:hypothetical protein
MAERTGRRYGMIKSNLFLLHTRGSHGISSGSHGLRGKGSGMRDLAITTIIPLCDDAEFVEQGLDSGLAQTYRPARGIGVEHPIGAGYWCLAHYPYGAA